MKITTCLNVDENDIRQKRFNIFIGISLGNKYFTREHIRNFLLWALENTKEKIAVLIPDKIHAINYEVKNDYSPERALAVARRKGDEVEELVADIVKEAKIPQSKIEIVRWEQIEDASYLKMLAIFRTAFKENQAFQRMVLNIVRETPHMQSFDFSDVQFEKLAQYVVEELPMLVSGVRVDGLEYDVLPYPGFANIDYFAIDLQEGKSFPDITKKLELENKLKLVEAYAE